MRFCVLLVTGHWFVFENFALRVLSENTRYACGTDSCPMTNHVPSDPRTGCVFLRLRTTAQPFHQTVDRVKSIKGAFHTNFRIKITIRYVQRGQFHNLISLKGYRVMSTVVCASDGGGAYFHCVMQNNLFYGCVKKKKTMVLCISRHFLTLQTAPLTHSTALSEPFCTG